MISVIVPTVTGREQWLENCLHAYDITTLGFEVIIEKDHPTCGKAWNAGIARARGDYIHLTADDLQPWPGWWQAAKQVADQGFLPAPRIVKPDGRLESCGHLDRERPDGESTGFTRIPFMTRAQLDRIGPMIELHYFTDIYVSERGRDLGIDTRVCRNYLFTHHWAMEGRLDTLAEEAKEYERIRAAS